MKKSLLPISAIIFLMIAKSLAQTKDSTSAFTISGYADAYYAYYTDSVGPDNFQQFPSVAPRSNQFGLNTAMLTAQYDAAKVRGTIALQYGDIPRSTWSSLFENIMEAHAGVNLCKKLWLDAGLFRTHFGTEGLLPKENITSSVSVNTFYEPYFESGIRLNYAASDHLAVNLYILNGYNRFDDNNESKSAGVLVTYTVGNATIGYSNYIGDDKPDSDPISKLRIHQNLFFNDQIGKLKIQIGGDYCMQQHSDLETGKSTATMFSGVAALKYQFFPKFAVYARGEIFNDPDGYMSTVIIDEGGEPTGYKLYGITAGAEYKPTENSYIRLEGRQLQMDNAQKIFYWDGMYKSSRLEGIINMGVWF